VRAPSDAFAFGKNWQCYVETYLDPERVAIAAQSLRDLTEDNLSGRRFIDIGAGSGLFSLCAHEAGAASVVSVDIDPDSVASCFELRMRSGDSETWTVLEGSILDCEFVDTIEPGDIVYSWGVLHHTGDMYTGIRQAARLVRPGGLFVIAVYNRATGCVFDSARWQRIKRRYNHSSWWVQRVMEGAFYFYWTAMRLRARRNPIRIAREYKKNRGMALRTDLIDWLGGYPYEYATADEIVSFCQDELALEVVKVFSNPPTGTGNNQFVFRRPAESVEEAA
jgi:2-polyprenyl-6-hydroxyphenyl methylase/3-demethylubiquinone-9 3-methyltransferase